MRGSGWLMLLGFILLSIRIPAFAGLTLEEDCW